MAKQPPKPGDKLYRVFANETTNVGRLHTVTFRGVSKPKGDVTGWRCEHSEAADGLPTLFFSEPGYYFTTEFEAWEVFVKEHLNTLDQVSAACTENLRRITAILNEAKRVAALLKSMRGG